MNYKNDYWILRRRPNGSHSAIHGTSRTQQNAEKQASRMMFHFGGKMEPGTQLEVHHRDSSAARRYALASTTSEREKLVKASHGEHYAAIGHGPRGGEFHMSDTGRKVYEKK